MSDCATMKRQRNESSSRWLPWHTPIGVGMADSKSTRKRKTLEERFWEKVDRSGGPEACWPWLAYTDTNGYGTFSVDCRSVLSHRVAYEIHATQSVPDGLWVIHRCSSRSCCNPSHLRVGRDAHQKRPLEERFWEKVEKRGPDDCWPWRGSKDRHGYGQIRSGVGTRPLLKASRVSYELHTGPIPAGMYILHSCDNPPCCNRRHLRAGTAQDNMDDRGRRGRTPCREGHPGSKLTEKSVAMIRRVYADGGVSQRCLARTFGVHQSTVSLIVGRINWPDATEVT